MFSREDFKIESIPDFLSHLIILPFIGLVAPFLLAAYVLGFVQEVTGWLDT